VSHDLVSASVFLWFITLATGGVSALWVLYDAVNLIRTRHLDRSDALVRDKHFGYAMGVLMGSLGILGSLRAHGVF
jgi:hypothetical protein